MDWKKMGFKSKEDYEKFLDMKMKDLLKFNKDLLNKINNDPKLLAVFKRLYDR